MTPIPFQTAKPPGQRSAEPPSTMPATDPRWTFAASATTLASPMYGLTDEQVEDMLLDALDHGEADLEARRLADARVEGQRILSATQKALASDVDLLSGDERSKVEQAVADLEQAIGGAKKASSIQLAIDSLEDVTHDWAGRRMDRAIRAATLGRALGDVEKRVENARGIEAHLEESAARHAEATGQSRGGVSVSLEEPKG